MHVVKRSSEPAILIIVTLPINVLKRIHAQILKIFVRITALRLFRFIAQFLPVGIILLGIFAGVILVVKVYVAFSDVPKDINGFAFNFLLKVCRSIVANLNLTSNAVGAIITTVGFKPQLVGEAESG